MELPSLTLDDSDACSSKIRTCCADVTTSVAIWLPSAKDVMKKGFLVKYPDKTFMR